MRLVIAAIVTLLLGPALDRAQADPYRWCANYGGGFDDGGFQNCYFMTLEQCQAAVSGVGGYCSPNQFYDGRPVTTPEDLKPRQRRRAR